MFKAKVRSKGKIYHFWKPAEDIPGLFFAICNPGLLRAKSELRDIRGNEDICKVCRIHLPTKAK